MQDIYTKLNATAALILPFIKLRKEKLAQRNFKLSIKVLLSHLFSIFNAMFTDTTFSTQMVAVFIPR